MKSLFNVIALVVDMMAASTHAAAVTLHKKGHVIGDLMDEVREGLEASNLPDALERLGKATRSYDLLTPKWAEGLEEKEQKLGYAFGKAMRRFETAREELAMDIYHCNYCDERHEGICPDTSKQVQEVK